MPDPTPTPGTQTSEYALTRLLVIVGVILQAGSAALATLPADTSQAKWVAIATAICGTGLQVLSVLGYTRSRTEIKTALIPPPAL